MIEKGTLVAVNLADGFHLESVDMVAGGTVSVQFMKRHKVLGEGGLEETDIYWCWPSQLRTYDVPRHAVLPVYPSIEISSKLTTRRNTVYTLNNYDIINILTR